MAATASMIRSVSRVRTPPARAMSLAFWMTGPSITGSEYGSSTSMTSQPASAIAIIEAMLSSTVGNPAGMQPTSTARSSALALLERRSDAMLAHAFSPGTSVSTSSRMPKYAPAVCTSLSPRPDRLTTIVGVAAQLRGQRRHDPLRRRPARARSRSPG